MIDPNDDRSEQFVRLLAECERQLFAYILALVWNVHDAEDLYQYTALELWRKFDEYQPGTNFAQWAFTTARLLVANFHRVQRRRKAFFSNKLVVALAERQAAVATENADTLADRLIECMKLLSEADQNLLRLCYTSGRTIKQIAEELGRPPQSTYNSLCRIRRRLFDCIRRLADREESIP